MTPSTARPGVRSILVPVDGSASSRRAVTLASEMAQSFGAMLTLLHVASVKELPVLMSEVEDPREDREAELVLGEDAKIARGYGVEPSIVVRHGHTATQILRQVEKSQPDLIVMGTRGLAGAKGVLMGSVSRTVAQKAKVQVVLVR
jgi:nucleotide-binding universal stress UspA family protein